MRMFGFRSSLIAVTLIAASTLIVASRGDAFVASEEHQFQADINEAIARARDFQRTMDRLKQEDIERERLGYLEKERKKREEETRERARKAYIAERDSRPDPQIERERLEREYQRWLEREERKREEARVRYIRARDRMREVLRREAYINEMVEYGLDSP